MHQKALKADPSFKLAAECLAIVLTDLGTSLKLAGNTQEGIQKYYEAIKIDPHYAPAYYNLGVVYSEMMQYDTALSYEKAAIERTMYAEAYCNMGVIYKNRGDLESAIACYERCLAVSPNFEIAKNNMAIALTDLGTKVKLEGDISHGVTLYKKALYYNWHYADAMYNLGVAYGEMLKFDMAIVFYELAFHFNPHCAEACNNLGVIYKDRDNLDKAVECYQMALSIKPNFSQSLNNLGVVYTVQGKMDAAASMIEKAIVANPTYAEAYNNLGVLYRDAGNISLAIEAYGHCLKIDPDSRNAGQVNFISGKPKRKSETACWQKACDGRPACRHASFYCKDDHTVFSHILNDSCPIQTANVTAFDFGIFLDALQSGVVASKDFPHKFFYCFWWGLQNLRFFCGSYKSLRKFGHNQERNLMLHVLLCCVSRMEQVMLQLFVFLEYS